MADQPKPSSKAQLPKPGTLPKAPRGIFNYEKGTRSGIVGDQPPK